MFSDFWSCLSSCTTNLEAAKISHPPVKASQSIRQLQHSRETCLMGSVQALMKGSIFSMKSSVALAAGGSCCLGVLMQGKRRGTPHMKSQAHTGHLLTRWCIKPAGAQLLIKLRTKGPTQSQHQFPPNQMSARKKLHSVQAQTQAEGDHCPSLTYHLCQGKFFPAANWQPLCSGSSCPESPLHSPRQTWNQHSCSTPLLLTRYRKQPEAEQEIIPRVYSKLPKAPSYINFS